MDKKVFILKILTIFKRKTPGNSTGVFIVIDKAALYFFI